MWDCLCPKCELSSSKLSALRAKYTEQGENLLAEQNNKAALNEQLEVFKEKLKVRLDQIHFSFFLVVIYHLYKLCQKNCYGTWWVRLLSARRHLYIFLILILKNLNELIIFHKVSMFIYSLHCFHTDTHTNTLITQYIALNF